MRRRVADGLGALAALVGFFLGVPVALATVVGWPLPATDELKAAVQLGYLPAHLVAQVAATVAWFAWAWLLAATVRMAVDTWTDRPARSALGAGWLRPLVVRAVGGLLVLSGLAGRAPAWAGASAAAPAPSRPVAAQPAPTRLSTEVTRRRPVMPGVHHRPVLEVVQRIADGDHDGDEESSVAVRSSPASSTPALAPTQVGLVHLYVVERGDTLASKVGRYSRR